MATVKEFIVITNHGLEAFLEELATTLVRGETITIRFTDGVETRTLPFVPISIDAGDSDRTVIHGTVAASNSVAFLHTEGPALILTTDH
ncbi:MAG: hypothetical protein WAS27_00115 [Candidatus Saccharimonadales bacterium]